MKKSVQISDLIHCGLHAELASDYANKINDIIDRTTSNEQIWEELSKQFLTPSLPFKLHVLLFSLCYPDWQNHPNTAAAWFPNSCLAQATHIATCLQETKMETLSQFHTWTTTHFEKYWSMMIKKLGIIFNQPPTKICDLSDSVMHPHWLVNAKLNIANSCFGADPNKTAIIYQAEGGDLHYFSYHDLTLLSDRVALSLLKNQLQPGDAIAIAMPMNVFAVAIYLGIIKMGGTVVSIADSFSSDEIAIRLKITEAKAIFTQDIILRGGKSIPLYEKVMKAMAPKAFVLAATGKLTCSLRDDDIGWQAFLVPHGVFHTYVCLPDTPSNILFSSGTTGNPKAIPWDHTTGIKAASDAYLHQNIHDHSILAWPTNLGWMMGPWLIYAALINKATLALYDGIPTQRAFGQFIQHAKVTMLGTVPTIVAHWRKTECMKGLDWSQIECFSSTGECSNPEDMLYLMSLAGYKPIIEYCGGTEIGGAYLSSTMIEKNYPSVFTTPVMGIHFAILDDEGRPSNKGEVALIPPSIGLSTRLLNADHDKIYFADMPELPNGMILRRHGDQIERFPEGTYCILGRSDDTMNLGGVKVSAAEVERVLIGIDDIDEVAAIAVNESTFGPSLLVIFATTQKKLDKDRIKTIMQLRLNQKLNPLFKIYDIVFRETLPKTASNKIIRRLLRDQYH